MTRAAVFRPDDECYEGVRPFNFYLLKLLFTGVTSRSVKRQRDGGLCDLDDWVMPFPLTLYKQ